MPQWSAQYKCYRSVTAHLNFSMQGQNITLNKTSVKNSKYDHSYKRNLSIPNIHFMCCSNKEFVNRLLIHCLVALSKRKFYYEVCCLDSTRFFSIPHGNKVIWPLLCYKARYCEKKGYHLHLLRVSGSRGVKSYFKANVLNHFSST